MFKINKTLLKKSLFILIPAVLSPLLIFGKELRCAFVISVVSLFWLSDVIPLGIASLLPLFLLPILGISDAKLVSQCYFKDNVVLFLASLIMAMAVEETQLHRRIALTLLSIVGSGKLWFFYSIDRIEPYVFFQCIDWNNDNNSFYVSGNPTFNRIWMFCSFFVSDTAATTLMLPISIAILSSIQEAATAENGCNEDASYGTSSMEKSNNSILNLEKKTEINAKLDLKKMSKSNSGFCKAVVLSVTHSSIIGGTGFLTGAGTNLVFREQLRDFYPEMEVGYVQWMSFSLPFTPLYLLASGIILTVCLSHFVIPRFFQIILMPGEIIFWKRMENEEDIKREKQMRKCIKTRYESLGSISFGEASVLGFLITLLFAWCLRNPGFIDGWGQLLPREGKFVKDSTVAVGLAILMFIWPRDPFNDDQWNPILSWSTMKDRFSWHCMFMIGAGFAISEAVKDSGLGDMIACIMNRHFAGLSNFWLQVLVTTTACFITEIASNIAAVGIIVPITLSLAKGFQVNPLYLGLPVTLSCSLAFMFPTATPGNAIVYSTKIVSLREMVLVGFLLNLACISISLLNFNTYSFWLLGLGEVSSVNSTGESYMYLICT